MNDPYNTQLCPWAVSASFNSMWFIVKTDDSYKKMTQNNFTIYWPSADCLFYRRLKIPQAILRPKLYLCRT